MVSNMLINSQGGLMPEDSVDITVIITAYDRKKFVADAIKSVFDQSYDTSRIELITISNFEVDLPHPVPAGIKVKTIKLEGTIGEFLYEGVSQARAEIVAFLDDDDMWEPSKVHKMISAFNGNRELIFYRNAVKYIDENGKPINNKRVLDILPCKLKGLHFFRKECLIKALPVILTCGGDFNLSTFACRKKIMKTPQYEKLRLIESGQDAFFFWVAVLTQGDFRMESEGLTLYRVHNLNVSGSIDTPSKSSEIMRQAKTFKILVEHSDESTDRRVYGWLNLLYHEYNEMSLIFGMKSRNIVGREFFKILRFPIRMIHTMRIELILLCTAYIISPVLALNFYTKINRRLSRK